MEKIIGTNKETAAIFTFIRNLQLGNMSETRFLR